ncbi:WD40 repeat domain-containing protein [Streptomyces sp. NPDC047718]|uniref:WD40 repeat domain-containing protein n=1 Tax=Streptomyces sp. NPDC047718 TaxID=3155479 RepID=UPI0033FF8FB3
MGTVAFAPDGHALVTGGWDGSVHVREADPARLLPRPRTTAAGPHDRDLWRRHLPNAPCAPGRRA